MASISRKDSEERQRAVLRFFMENPSATGEEAQRALVSGRLLSHKGKNQMPMGLGMLFRLKRQAEMSAKKGERPPEAPMFKLNGGPLTEDQLRALRNSGHELQRLLSELPATVLEVHITRDGVRVVRMQQTEETLD